MKDFSYYRGQIIAKRTQTSFRNFLKEIVSWQPFVLSRNNAIVSRFPETDRVESIPKDQFNNLQDDLIKKGLIYDFEKDFFANFQDLFQKTPLPNVFHYRSNENSDYTDIAVDTKNTYLSSSVVLYSENVCYSFMVRGKGTKNVFNSLYVSSGSENVYCGIGVIQGYKIFYSSFITNSSDIWFSSNLIGCNDCIFCNDLTNQKYCIYNKCYNKDDYKKEKKKILVQKDMFDIWFTKINKQGVNYGSHNITGNYVIESENIVNGHYVFNTQNAKNVMFLGATGVNEDFYDVFVAGGSGRHDIYGVANTGGADHVYCSGSIGYGMNVYYSYFLEQCSFCIGCVGLKNKQYCIFNKEYPKDEWEDLACKIFKQMDKDGILGDFFPGKLNPFYFNDTIAGMLGDFSRKEVEKDGYLWREEEVKVDIPEGSELVKVSELDTFEGFNLEGNWSIDRDILQKVIVDKEGNYYRIVAMEYDFLMKQGLPLPRLHWMDRMKLNFGV